MADIYKRIKAAVVIPFQVAERNRIQEEERQAELRRMKLTADRKKEIDDAFAAAVEKAKTGKQEDDDSLRARILLRATPLVTPIEADLAEKIAVASGQDLDDIGEAYKVRRIPAIWPDVPGEAPTEQPPIHAPPAVEAAPAPVAAKPQTRGSSGKAMGLTMLKRAKIVDRKLLLAHFAEHPDISEVLQKLANASVKMKITPPGCEIDEVAAGANG